MKYLVKVEKEAEKDILIAKCHYKLSNNEKMFNKDFLNLTEYLKANPYLFQVYYKNIRVAHFKNFLYSIHFIINKQEVLILRVLHQKQKFK